MPILSNSFVFLSKQTVHISYGNKEKKGEVKMKLIWHCNEIKKSEKAKNYQETNDALATLRNTLKYLAGKVYVLLRNLCD